LKPLNVLICCEESGIVRRAFRGRGHNAWSNDLIKSDDDSEYHLTMDCRTAIRNGNYYTDGAGWDLIIMHPPCDALALSGNRWYGRGMRDHHKRLEAVDWTLDLWYLAINHAKHVALENPKSVIFPLLAKTNPVQWIQPYHFGHPEMKETGFALHNLPELSHVNPLTPPKPGTPEYIEWQKVWRMAPSDDRKKLRSRTYHMVADAMASQWGAYALQERE